MAPRPGPRLVNGPPSGRAAAMSYVKPAAGTASASVSLNLSTTGPAAGKTSTAPGNTAERALVLVSVMDRLTPLLMRERQLVQQGALEEVAGLQTDKLTLAGRLDELGRLIRLDRAGLAALEPELMARLSESAHRLEQATLANHETLATQAAAQQRLVDVLVRTSNQEQRSVAAYRVPGGGNPSRSASAAAFAAPTRTSTFSATL